MSSPLNARAEAQCLLLPPFVARLEALPSRAVYDLIVVITRLHSSHFYLRSRVHEACSGAIGQDHGAVRANLSGWNRNISSLQADEHSCLFASGHKPQYEPRAVDNRIRQRHALPSLVDSGKCNVRIFDIANRISGNQRGSVAIGSESQVNKIKHWRRTGDRL